MTQGRLNSLVSIILKQELLRLVLSVLTSGVFRNLETFIYPDQDMAIILSIRCYIICTYQIQKTGYDLLIELILNIILIEMVLPECWRLLIKLVQSNSVRIRYVGIQYSEMETTAKFKSSESYFLPQSLSRMNILFRILFLSPA